MKKYRLELTEKQIKDIHEALKERMEDYAADGMLEETNIYAELQELFGEPIKFEEVV